MRINGKAIANTILHELTNSVTTLRGKGVTPTLAVILVGDNPASLSYIKQKQKAADIIGARLVLSHQRPDISSKNLQKLLDQYNGDESVHGIIIQRPVPELTLAKILNSVSPQKDVDGFVPNSPFEIPVAKAVVAILKEIFNLITKKNNNFPDWLHQQHIVVIGRGETAGKPIADLLKKMNCRVSVIHAHTENPNALIQSADIVISCVGKPEIVRRDNIKQGAVLISVGIWRDNDGHLHGDYEEGDIETVASWYTPTPGGVGPVNVSCLMQNLVKACIMEQGGRL